LITLFIDVTVVISVNVITLAEGRRSCFFTFVCSPSHRVFFRCPFRLVSSLTVDIVCTDLFHCWRTCANLV